MEQSETVHLSRDPVLFLRENWLFSEPLLSFSHKREICTENWGNFCLLVMTTCSLVAAASMLWAEEVTQACFTSSALQMFPPEHWYLSATLYHVTFTTVRTSNGIQDSKYLFRLQTFIKKKNGSINNFNKFMPKIFLFLSQGTHTRKICTSICRCTNVFFATPIIIIL